MPNVAAPGGGNFDNRLPAPDEGSRKLPCRYKSLAYRPPTKERPASTASLREKIASGVVG